MKLAVRYTDFELRKFDLINTGHMPPVACRVATIVTAEQAEALTPRSIGSTWNRETGTQDPILETREVIALED